MEPVTHFLTGACLGRAGFNRTTAYATLAMTMAAEAPDIDVLWAIRGPVAGFQHHRGITHTFLGAPLMALIVTGAVWLWHRWRSRRAEKKAAGDSTGNVYQKGATQKILPVRWGWVWFLALIADLSHLLLDWTNNYGVRPFFPFDARWYAGNILFIFEPLIFLVLLAALVLPAILGLVDREIGVPRQVFHGRGWAIFALCCAVVLGSWRWAEHERALHLLAQQNYQNEAPLKMTVSPYPIDPFHWFGVVETRDFYQTARLNTRTGEFVSHTPEDVYYKQPQTPAILAAERSWLGRVFLDWSKFPLVEEMGMSGPFTGNSRPIRVHFEDLRFAFKVFFMNGRNDNPLGGTVTIAPDGKVEGMQMSGRVQKQK